MNIGNNISKIFNLNISKNKYILEGGSIEADGRGTCLTTKQCLLNKNRNPQLKQIDIETNLKNELGLKNILWIDSGLYGDHTDGHIDTLARFIAPGQIICMYAKYKTDPNYYTLKNNITKLKKFKDITGKYFDIIEIESPGVIRNYKGKIMPASYINFYHANNSVIIPNFNNNINETTLDILSKYSKKRIVTLAAENILTGGGTFNCITLQIPSGDNID